MDLPSKNNEYCNCRGREDVLNKDVNTKKWSAVINRVSIEKMFENKNIFNRIITSKYVPLELLLQLNCERFSNEVIGKNLTKVLIIEAKLVVICIKWIRMNSISRSAYLHIGTRLRMAFTSDKKMSI